MAVDVDAFKERIVYGTKMPEIGDWRTVRLGNSSRWRLEEYCNSLLPWRPSRWKPRSRHKYYEDAQEKLKHHRAMGKWHPVNEDTGERLKNDYSS